MSDEQNGEIDYPHTRQMVEMELVQLLHRRRCWADIEAIIEALQQVRMQAEDMDRERRMFDFAAGTTVYGAERNNEQ